MALMRARIMPRKHHLTMPSELDAGIDLMRRDDGDTGRRASALGRWQSVHHVGVFRQAVAGGTAGP